jgi:hypothetical protein
VRLVSFFSLYRKGAEREEKPSFFLAPTLSLRERRKMRWGYLWKLPPANFTDEDTLRRLQPIFSADGDTASTQKFYLEHR